MFLLENFDERLEPCLDLAGVPFRVIGSEFQGRHADALEFPNEVVLGHSIAGAEFQVGVDHPIHPIVLSKGRRQIQPIFQWKLSGARRLGQVGISQCLPWINFFVGVLNVRRDTGAVVFDDDARADLILDKIEDPAITRF